MKLAFLQNVLTEKGLKIFSTRDLKLLLGISEAATQRLLWRYVKRGLLVKLRRGLYALAGNIPSSYLVANKLYQPSYISFDTALSYYDIIPETIYPVTSATTMITREFIATGATYIYHRIKKEAYTGYKPARYRDTIILIAEPEKALADYLYFVDIKRRGLHYERMDLKKISQKKLLAYVGLFKRPGMFGLIKEIYAEFRKPPRIY